MSKRAHINDISVGKDRWIEFGDIDADWANAIPVDSILAPVLAFVERLETNCLVACCGIHAFSFWPDDIKNALGKLDLEAIESLAASLANVHAKINGMNADLFKSPRLNQCFHKVALLRLLTHVRHVVENCRPRVTP